MKKNRHYRSTGTSKRKGSLEETLSYALHRGKTSEYSVTYRDMDSYKTAALHDFMNGEDYSDIPTSRIVMISRTGKAVWKKGQKEILVK